MSKRSKKRKKGRGQPGKRRLYFAYGSNLDMKAFKRRAPDAEAVSPATLKDWRLTFRGVADVEPAKGKEVVGAVWSVTRSDLRAIDRYEGAPHYYERRWVEVETGRGRVRAITYVMVSAWEWEEGLPSPSYLSTIVRGYRHFGLPLPALNRTLAEVRAEHEDRGIDRYVPRGKKRMMAVATPLSAVRVDYVERFDGETRSYGWGDDDGYDDPRAGMSPATRSMYEAEERWNERQAQRAAEAAAVVA